MPVQVFEAVGRGNGSQKTIGGLRYNRSFPVNSPRCPAAARQGNTCVKLCRHHFLWFEKLVGEPHRDDRLQVLRQTFIARRRSLIKQTGRANLGRRLCRSFPKSSTGGRARVERFDSGDQETAISTTNSISRSACSTLQGCRSKRPNRKAIPRG